jgi:uncharacterized membrane protein YfcA
MTLLGMALGSRFSRTPTEEQQRTQAFFAAMQHSLASTPANVSRGNPAGPALAAATLGMGALIVVAGLISHSVTARSVDSAVGITLVVIGLLLYMRANRHRLTATFALDPEEDRIHEAEER